MKKDVFQNCPTYQSERFEIRKMEMKDAHGLFQCYSNPQAARYFNGDCCGDDFYYTDYEKFLECMKFLYILTRKNRLHGHSEPL